MPAKKATKLDGYAKLKECGLLKNLSQVAAGFRKAGLPGLAAVVDGFRKDAKPGIGYFEFTEFYDQAHWLCGFAIFALADLGFPVWIRRREAHLKQMALKKHIGPQEAAEYEAQVAAIRGVMRFADGPPKAKRPKKPGAKKA